MKKYICVVGRSGAGKETVYQMAKKLLEGKGFSVSIHHFSDPLNYLLKYLLIPKGRQNQQTFSTLLRTAKWLDENEQPFSAEWGQEMLSRILERLALADTADVVFLDGVRRPADLAMLRRLPSNLLVGVVRDSEKRYQGLRQRADRPGDAEKTWKQFCHEQEAEPEQLIDQIIAEADFTIYNEWTFEELEGAIDILLEHILA